MKVMTNNSKEPITLRVSDIYGRVIEVKQGIVPNSNIRFGNQYSSGIYFSEIIQGKKRVTVKLIKQ
jgi:hypothetical protein